MDSKDIQLRYQNLFIILSTFFAVIVIVSNIVTVKLIAIPFMEGLAIPCGLITYPVTFLIGDLVTEIYGEQRAKTIVYLGFFMALISYCIIKLALLLPPHPQWVTIANAYGFSSTEGYQQAFHSVFDINGIALVSSMMAYAASQLMDIRLFSFIREITRSRHLWLRNSGSTLTSQIIDTLVVNLLLLYCGMKLNLDTVIHISLFCYLYKACFTICSIPIFYAMVWAAKKYLKINSTQPSSLELVAGES